MLELIIKLLSIIFRLKIIEFVASTNVTYQSSLKCPLQNMVSFFLRLPLIFILKTAVEMCCWLAFALSDALFQGQVCTDVSCSSGGLLNAVDGPLTTSGKWAMTILKESCCQKASASLNCSSWSVRDQAAAPLLIYHQVNK